MTPSLPQVREICLLFTRGVDYRWQRMALLALQEVGVRGAQVWWRGSQRGWRGPMGAAGVSRELKGLGRGPRGLWGISWVLSRFPWALGEGVLWVLGVPLGDWGGPGRSLWVLRWG